MCSNNKSEGAKKARGPVWCNQGKQRDREGHSIKRGGQMGQVHVEPC